MSKADNPLVSLIVPVYNVEKYIDECLGSIVSQSYENIEIILVDDASLDNSRKKCDLWAKRDKRVRVIRKQKNEGLFLARIAGFESMSGEYFMTIDSDDYIESNFVQTFFNEAISSGSDITISDVFTIVGESIEQKIASVTLRYSSLNVLDGFMDGLASEKWGWSMWAKMYKTSLYEKARPYLIGIDVKINASEDLLFAVIFCYFAQKSSYVDKKYGGYFYRQNPKSITGSVSPESLAAKLNDVTKVFFEIEIFLSAVNCFSQYEQTIATSKFWHLRSNIELIGGMYAAPLLQHNTELQQHNTELQQHNTQLQQHNTQLQQHNTQLQQHNTQLQQHLKNVEDSKVYKLSRVLALPYVKLRNMLHKLI